LIYFLYRAIEKYETSAHWHNWQLLTARLRTADTVWSFLLSYLIDRWRNGCHLKQKKWKTLVQEQLCPRGSDPFAHRCTLVEDAVAHASCAPSCTANFARQRAECCEVNRQTNCTARETLNDDSEKEEKPKTLMPFRKTGRK
jgi:hypothetical protein